MKKLITFLLVCTIIGSVKSAETVGPEIATAAVQGGIFSGIQNGLSAVHNGTTTVVNGVVDLGNGLVCCGKSIAYIGYDFARANINFTYNHPVAGVVLNAAAIAMIRYEYKTIKKKMRQLARTTYKHARSIIFGACLSAIYFGYRSL